MQKLLIYICLVLFAARCAQITPLTGGKRDVSPPMPLSYEPKNASLNFNSKVIEISFDEYITVKDLANQFIITPQCKENPEISAQGKKLKISFNETLLPNTTYKLAFGSAICDINESNALQNFEYVFSTGSAIDSFKLKGKIIDALNNQSSSNILVGLYDASAIDSVIYKEKPLYISKTNSAGEFRFNYLPNTSFKIIGINDKNKNLLYDGSGEEIAFSKTLVNTTDTLEDITLPLFKEVPTKSFIKRAAYIEYGKVIIPYNKPQPDIKNVRAKGLVYYKQSLLKDSLIVYYTNKYDTLETFIDYESKKTDTIYINILSETALNKQIKNNPIKYSLQPNFGAIIPFFTFPTFELNFPVDPKNILEDKMTLLEQTDSLVKAVKFKVPKEKNLMTSFKIEAELKPEANYTLTIQQGAINNDSQRTNDSLGYKFKTTALDDYAQLKVKLLFPKKENYLVRLLNDKDQLINETVVELSLTSTSEKIIEYKNVIPGSYFLRVVEDVNKNNAFDMGDYFLKTQPETIFINSTPIKLLSGWEIENEWIVK